MKLKLVHKEKVRVRLIPFENEASIEMGLCNLVTPEKIQKDARDKKYDFIDLLIGDVNTEATYMYLDIIIGKDNVKRIVWDEFEYFASILTDEGVHVYSLIEEWGDFENINWE